MTPRRFFTRLLAALAVVALGAVLTACAPQSPAADPPASVPQGTQLPELPKTGPDPAVGRVAPALTGANFTGEPVMVTPGDGTAKLIVFFAHWCPVCQRELPVIADWLADGGAPAGMEVVAISAAEDEVRPNWPPAAWFSREQWPTPVLSDANNVAVGKYGVTALPYLVVVNPDGTVAARASGAQTPEQLSALVETAS